MEQPIKCFDCDVMMIATIVKKEVSIQQLYGGSAGIDEYYLWKQYSCVEKEEIYCPICYSTYYITKPNEKEGDDE